MISSIECVDSIINCDSGKISYYVVQLVSFTRSSKELCTIIARSINTESKRKRVLLTNKINNTSDGIIAPYAIHAKNLSGYRAQKK